MYHIYQILGHDIGYTSRLFSYKSGHGTCLALSYLCLNLWLYFNAKTTQYNFFPFLLSLRNISVYPMVARRYFCKKAISILYFISTKTIMYNSTIRENKISWKMSHDIIYLELSIFSINIQLHPPNKSTCIYSYRKRQWLQQQCWKNRKCAVCLSWQWLCLPRHRYT